MKTARPFPWVCPSCAREAVVPQVIQYSTLVKRDGVVYDVKIPDLEVPSCSACGEVIITDSADARIRLAQE